MRFDRRQFCLKTLRNGASLLVPTWMTGACGLTNIVAEPDILRSLAFGSCNKQNMLSTHWPIIKSKNAQGWLWMGDAIYADEMAPHVRAGEYLKVLTDKGYQSLLSQSFVLGTWDDHDYYTNDAGSEYSEKAASQKLFLDFIGESADSTRRQQEGLYSSRLIGKEGSQIQFILLDMRSFKEKSSPTADPLGAKQWDWLESELLRPGSALKIVVSSIQVITDFLGKETWGCYPEAQKRFYNLLARSPVQVLLLSGDRHLSEIAAYEVGSDRVVHEITSSGLTHFTDLTNSNPYRVREQINATNFGVLKFDWNTTEKAELLSTSSSIYSPQTGELIRDFHIPFKWI